MTRAWLSLAALAACAGTAPRAPDAPGAPRPGTEPKLVVLLVIDQLPEWSFAAKRPALTGGFDRVLREGEWHVGQHPSAATITAVGHALLGTGEPPYHSGILANEWWHRDVERSLKAIEGEGGGMTHQWLRVPGLGDSIAAAGAGGKAVSISLKDRAAILPLGHTGTAIWYDPGQPGWTSLAPVAWLAAWNKEQPVAAHLHDVWNALPQTAALAGIPDDAPGETGGEKRFGTTFPHALDRTPNPADSIFATPLGNDLVFDTATAAIAREHLGADSHADLLVMSLSAHDYIGHAWGQESWEAWDAMLRIDRRLGRFLTELDDKVGKGRWALVITSDHGASPMPETQRGGRIAYEQIKDAANRAAIAELGPGDWIAASKYPTVYLSKAALAQKPKDLATAITKIVYALRSFPGLARVEKTADFMGHCETRTGDDQALCMTLDPERSGEILYLPAPGWVLVDKDPVATGHGSLNAYDRLVPLLVLAPGRASHAALTHPDAGLVSIVAVAPMLARWLGVTPPTELPHPQPKKTTDSPL